MYYFEYVVVLFGVEIYDEVCVVFCECVECGDVFFCEIDDVDVVVYVGVVWCWVV